MKDFRIHTVNGIKSDGSRSTDRLGTVLANRYGYDVNDINQPIRTAWGARFKAHKDAKQIVDQTKDGDILVAHSYGGLKSAIANRGVNYAAMFLFRPAMSRWHKFPRYQDTKIFCIYSKQDYTILAGSLALYHPFGLAGFKGFRSPFVQNIRSHGPHSHDFTSVNVTHWADFIDRTIKSIKWIPNGL